MDKIRNWSMKNELSLLKVSYKKHQSNLFIVNSEQITH